MKLGIQIGDRVHVEINEKHGSFKIKPVVGKVDQELVKWTKAFIERYRPALETLAKK